jgi:hypothetical protein
LNVEAEDEDKEEEGAGKDEDEPGDVTHHNKQLSSRRNVSRTPPDSFFIITNPKYDKYCL